MGKTEKYSIDFKLDVVGKYEQGTCGYKKLARAYGLSRDTVRSWCLNPRLREITTMARKKKNNNEEYALEYYKTAALFWETYAKNVEAARMPLVPCSSEFCVAKLVSQKCTRMYILTRWLQSGFIFFYQHKRMKLSICVTGVRKYK